MNKNNYTGHTINKLKDNFKRPNVFNQSSLHSAGGLRIGRKILSLNSPVLKMPAIWKTLGRE